MYLTYLALGTFGPAKPQPGVPGSELAESGTSVGKHSLPNQPYGRRGQQGWGSPTVSMHVFTGIMQWTGFMQSKAKSEKNKN